ncbi:MAG: ArsR family transcriptional regulator [Candidatus Lokiarchaeota archaeon]|nr:ArsR family transcriptional regulator [Candidatus Lokiarchaeota archaeon]MBD3199517.1 ArsR family transcriptional regulator [Candidatus Lokiarchaeota archaeon]
MSKQNSPKSKEIDTKQLEEQIAQQIKIADALNKMIRIRILTLLWIYREQSVNDLCEKLGKSWPTVNTHLEALEESGLLDIRRVKSPGPKNKKLYSVKPNMLKYTRLNPDFLKLPPEKVVEILMKDIESDAKTLTLIQKVLDDIPPYQEELQRKLKQMSPSNEKLKQFYLKKHINYYVETLDEEDFEYYFEKQMELFEELEEFKKEKKQKDSLEETEKSYILFQVILPVREIQKARSNRLWKV